MAHIIFSSESHTSAFFILHLAHMPRTSLVIHSFCNIRAFLFHSVLLQISIYAATLISSYFCPLNVSIHISPFLIWNLIISWDNFHIIFLMFAAHFCAYNWTILDCCRWYNVVISASIWGKLISVCIHRSSGLCFPEQHIPESIILMQWPCFWEKPLLLKDLFLAFFANRSVM